MPAGMAQAQDMFAAKPIVNAVREGDEEKVRQALLKGENPNQNDTSGRPLLMVAVMGGQIAVVETLLKGGAAVDATDREGYTALFQAAQRGDSELVDILLKRNAKPNLQNRQGVTALMVASRAWLRRDRAGAARQEGRPQHGGLHRPHGGRLCAPVRAHHDRGHAAQGRRTRVMAAAKAAPIWITGALTLDPGEIEETFVRAAGPGGQHVNTTSTAVQLRFDVRHSPSLPDDVRQRLERLAGRRLTRDGVLVLVAQGERSQKRNREEALDRLVALIRAAAQPPVPRKKTRTPKASKRRRLDDKKRHGTIKIAACQADARLENASP